MKIEKYIQSAIWCITISLCCTSFVHAQTIYKTVNKDGSISYSDQPSAGAKKVELSENSNTIITPSPVTQKKVQVIKTPSSVQHKLIISSPSNEQTIRNNSGQVNIISSVQPNKNGRYVLKLRDKTFESVSGTFALKDLERGAYPFQINFLDNTGKVIASSPTQRFYLHKASVLIKPPTTSN